MEEAEDSAELEEAMAFGEEESFEESEVPDDMEDAVETVLMSEDMIH